MFVVVRTILLIGTVKSNEKKIHFGEKQIMK